MPKQIRFRHKIPNIYDPSGFRLSFSNFYLDSKADSKAKIKVDSPASVSHRQTKYGYYYLILVQNKYRAEGKFYVVSELQTLICAQIYESSNR